MVLPHPFTLTSHLTPKSQEQTASTIYLLFLELIINIMIRTIIFFVATLLIASATAADPLSGVSALIESCSG